MGNVIMRPVYNRPEMLSLSLEYEQKAREHFDFGDDLTTLFIIDAGAHPKSIKLVKNYPFNSSSIVRETQLGLTENILEGFKIAFDKTDSYVIYVEDDILLHKTYFQYMRALLDHTEVGKFSVLSAYNKDDKGDVHEIYRGSHYAALAPLISKEFHQKYIRRYSHRRYYITRSGTVTMLNNKYKKYWGKGYKYTDARHNEQAGLINRLVDVCKIEGDGDVIMP